MDLQTPEKAEVAVITNHAMKRMKERCGFTKKAAKRMAEKAFETGYKHKDLNGSLKSWIDMVYFAQKKANNVRIYGNFAYLFRDNILLTVITVPNNLIGLLNDLREKGKQDESCLF